MTQPPHPTAANGHPTPQQQLEAVAYTNYAQIGQQLAAINTLLAAIPLDALLTACKRHQTTSLLTLPAGVSAEQAQAVAAALRADEKVITAALNLQRVARAVAQGGGA